MDQTVIFVLAAVIIIGAAVLALIGFAQKGAKRLDVERYRSDWLGIENRISKDDTGSYSLAVLNADKLVDKALKERGTRGGTMGERMKSAHATFSNNNAIWSAHKLRNRIVHESDAVVSYDEARRALHAFKQALKDLGAI